MWYFFLASPGTWLLIGLALIGFLIWLGIKSAVKSLPAPADKATADAKWKRYKETVGPMSWQERIFTILFFTVFVALVAWIASVT